MENYTSNKNPTSVFMIQPGYVEGIVAEPLQFDSVEAAFENLFRNNKEFCVIVWNQVPFKLSYPEDIPFLIRPITELLDAVINSDETHWETRLNSKNCECTWKFSPFDGDLITTGNFTRVSGGHQKAINSVSMFTMDKNTFLSEWKLLVEQVVTAFRESGYQLTNPEGQKLIDDLAGINESIPGRALRYQYNKR